VRTNPYCVITKHSFFCDNDASVGIPSTHAFVTMFNKKRVVESVGVDIHTAIRYHIQRQSRFFGSNFTNSHLRQCPLTLQSLVVTTSHPQWVLCYKL